MQMAMATPYVKTFSSMFVKIFLLQHCEILSEIILTIEEKLHIFFLAERSINYMVAM